MKHAIIIMAQLYHLSEYFSQDCYLFIHIDKRTNVCVNEINKIKSLPQVVFVSQKYKIHWGGYSILKCEYYMLKKAIKECDAKYFHIISGQDYPVRPLPLFLRHFENIDNINYMSIVHLPHPKWEHNTFERFQYYYPYDLFDNGKKSRWKVKKCLDFQKKYIRKRRIPDDFPHLYGGSQWFSICKKSLERILDYTQKEPHFFKRMRMTFAPEESYFHTVLANLEKEKIVPYNYRYILWKFQNGNIPANLSINNFSAICRGNYFFARKISQKYSKELVKLIDDFLITDKQPLNITETGGWEYNGYLRYSYSKLFVDYIYNFCALFNIRDVLDMGCGCGLYVAALREKGILVAGYDANPYVESLSKRILPIGDEPCHYADLTSDLEPVDKFDLVYCKDVMSYIPHKHIEHAIDNLVKMSSKYIVLNWYNSKKSENPHIYEMDVHDVIENFRKRNFAYVKERSIDLEEKIKDYSNNKYYIFKRL